MNAATLTDVFEETERRLNEWGASCRRNSRVLGYRVDSGIALMIEKVRVFDRRRKDVRRRRIECDECGLVHHSPACPKCGKERPIIHGKQTETFRTARIELSSSVVEIDKVVAELPEWMKVTIHRTYLRCQPHRISARELHVEASQYRLQWRAAVAYVAERLAERHACTLHSVAPRAREV